MYRQENLGLVYGSRWGCGPFFCPSIRTQSVTAVTMTVVWMPSPRPIPVKPSPSSRDTNIRRRQSQQAQMLRAAPAPLDRSLDAGTQCTETCVRRHAPRLSSASFKYSALSVTPFTQYIGSRPDHRNTRHPTDCIRQCMQNDICITLSRQRGASSKPNHPTLNPLRFAFRKTMTGNAKSGFNFHTLSSGKNAFSSAAVSGLSEAYPLRIISVPKSPRMVPAAASFEFVGPSNSCTAAMTCSPATPSALPDDCS